MSQNRGFGTAPNWGSQTSMQPNVKSTTNNIPISEDKNYSFSRDNSTDGIKIYSGAMAVHEDDTNEFFRPMFEPDERIRNEALRAVIDLLKQSLETPQKHLIRAHLSRIVRFSREVPFEEITNAFSDLLRQIEKTGEFQIPKTYVPSSFIPKRLFPPVGTDDPKIHHIFAEIFYSSGRVSHLNRVIALHVSYFEKYYETFNFVMREPGLPLPLSWRNYIAILAAARHRCRWLINIQETEFLANDGDPEWLKGVDHIPKKLQALLDVNQILNHQPWLITKEHINQLAKGEDSWSIGEIVHAMIVICSFKAMTGIVFGCGVTHEVDFPDSSPSTFEASEDEDNDEDGEDEKLAELLKEGNWEADEGDKETSVAHFMNAESSDDSLSSSHKRRSVNDSYCLKYIGRNWPLQHEDFDVKSKKIFRVQDYGWKEDGFELARRFLPGAATLLDEEFDHIYYMTYNKFNQNTNVDTFPFRQAIWQYVQRVQGIFHDDYDYQQVNIFLNRNTKSFVKKVICYAEDITKSDYRNFGLSHDEKVHATILAVASSKQSELLYGLHAVMKHMYNS